MYLKSIDVSGYKSFASKTHLDLEPGITGIIGPNGCGKSNIMECVRWCLGEMSWKSLRADSMVEVIFAGTAKRPALGMAEVTLTFDNASSLLPVQFSEVTISRRIFRSGESAYFLNKTQCRLRDIRELFLDTGLGGDGYAIIDQGGVDAMISAKPEDRRSFFEEAAGVAKYKAKREEALRKLERVEMDMGRLQDSVVLIDEQVKKLDSDARKAKLFQKYKEELAGLEAAHVLQQLTAIASELEALAGVLSPLEETLGTRRTEMNAEGATLAALNLDKAGQQNRVIEVNARIAELKSEIGRLEERVGASLRQAEGALARTQACEAEAAAMEERLGALGPELEKASAAETEAEIARAAALSELEGWGAELAALSQRVAEAEAAVEALKGEGLSAAGRALSLRRRLSESQSAESRRELQLRAALRDLEKDSAAAERGRSEIESLRSAMAEQEGRSAAAQAAAGEAEGLLSERRKRLYALSEDAVRLHSALASARARREALEAQGGQNPYWVGAQAVLNAGLPGVIGTVRSLFKADDAAKPYLEDLLGERLYAVVCEDSIAARSAVEFLEASGKGRARFLVLSALPPVLSERAYPEEARPLLRQLRWEPAHEAAVRFLFEEAYTMGRVLFGTHWVCGGSAEKESPSLSLSDLGELAETVASCEAREAALAVERESCQASIVEGETLAREAASVAQTEGGRVEALASQLRDREASLELSLQSVELSTGEAARLLAEMAEAREELMSVQGEIAAAEAAQEALRAREGEAQAAFGTLKEEAARARGTEDLLKSKLQGAEEKKRFMAAALERLQGEGRQLAEGLERRRGELAELSARKSEAEATAEESRRRLSELQTALAALEGEAQQAFSRLQDIERAISEKDAVLRDLKAVCEEAQAKLHELELKASAQKSTQDLLRTRLWDDWQLTFDEAKGKFAGQTADPERIEFLKKRIVSLGNVNMAAPEEYEALAQKQTFLATQIEDLTKARDDLKAAIQKINGATRENFRQTFTEVREHFRKLFGVLFEGGEADLLLTEPENILETGVEIVAQPPGKRLQSITLLSGGEKTLTAIALLFAFFLVKPSPFCMLDEADAALDDANIERFVGLLREFQARTQFLIVSHNKRTMEAADVIYGVTMEEMGVSQMISVDFRKKEGPAAEAPKRPETHGPFEKAPAPAPQASPEPA